MADAPSSTAANYQPPATQNIPADQMDPDHCIKVREPGANAR